MSFILDALRKSENERQRQAGPALAEIPVARPVTRRPPTVGIAIGALVAVNLAVLGYFLLRSPAPTPAAVAPAATVATTPAAAPATPAVSAPLAAEATRELRPLAGEATAEYDEAPPAQYQPPAAPDPSLLPPPRQATRAPPAARPAAASDNFVPTIDDLTPQATAGLPTLNLDLHVYATDPGQRFVFINNRRYLEGATMPEGVRVERITRDGVVLQWHGMQFLLPRQ